MQDALLSAWNKRDQFDSSARLETWIHRIAVNAALQLLRKRRPDTFDPLEDDVADTSALPETATLAQELDERIVRVALMQEHGFARSDRNAQL